MENKIQEMVEKLKAQNELLKTLFTARKKVSEEYYKLGIHDEVWKALKVITHFNKRGNNPSFYINWKVCSRNCTKIKTLKTS